MLLNPLYVNSIAFESHRPEERLVSRLSLLVPEFDSLESSRSIQPRLSGEFCLITPQADLWQLRMWACSFVALTSPTELRRSLAPHFSEGSFPIQVLIV